MILQQLKNLLNQKIVISYSLFLYMIHVFGKEYYAYNMRFDFMVKYHNNSIFLCRIASFKNKKYPDVNKILDDFFKRVNDISDFIIYVSDKNVYKTMIYDSIYIPDVYIEYHDN